MDDGLTTRHADEHIDLQKDGQIDMPRSNRQKDRLSVKWSIRLAGLLADRKTKSQ